MNLLKFLGLGRNEEARSIETPAVPISAGNLISFGGNIADTGMIVNEKTAMQSAAFAGCVRLIAEAFGGLSFDVYQKTKNGRNKRPEHAVSKVLQFPNDQMTSFSLRSSVTANALLHGAGFCYINKDGAEVSGLLPLDPKTTYPARTNGQLFYWTQAGGKPYPLTPDQVLVIPGLTFDGVRGFGVLDHGQTPIALGLAADKFSAKFYKNNAHLGGYFTHPAKLSDQARQNILSSWAANQSGMENAFKAAILQEGMEWNSYEVPQEKAQFLQTKKYNSEDICRLCGVMPSMIGLDTGNIQEHTLHFIKFTLRSWVLKWEEEILVKLFTESEKPTFYAEFNLDSLERADIKTRFESYNIGRQIGLYSVNMIAEKENLDPIDGGDVHLVPLNMVAIDQLKESPGLGPSLPAPANNQPTNNTNTPSKFSRLLEDSAKRVLTKETKAVERAAKKFLPQDPQGFLSWAKEFYGAHAQTIRSSFEPVLATIADEIQSEPRLDTFAAELIEASKQELALALWDENPSESIERLLERWQTTRATTIARKTLEDRCTN